MTSQPFDRLALEAVDVQRAARTFKTLNTKYQRIEQARAAHKVPPMSRVDRTTVNHAAYELQQAAMRAWRLALAQEATTREAAQEALALKASRLQQVGDGIRRMVQAKQAAYEAAQALTPTTEIATCCNCGDTTTCVARQDHGAMCEPCWVAEREYVDRHFADDEIDNTFWAALWLAFARAEARS